MQKHWISQMTQFCYYMCISSSSQDIKLDKYRFISLYDDQNYQNERPKYVDSKLHLALSYRNSRKHMIISFFTQSPLQINVFVTCLYQQHHSFQDPGNFSLEFSDAAVKLSTYDEKSMVTTWKGTNLQDIFFRVSGKFICTYPHHGLTISPNYSEDRGELLCYSLYICVLITVVGTALMILACVYQKSA